MTLFIGHHLGADVDISIQTNMQRNSNQFFFFSRFFGELVNGLGAPSVMPPFTLGLGTPLTTGAYGNAIPSLGAFALATSTGMGQTNPASLRGFSNVLLVSNLNEEVS